MPKRALAIFLVAAAWIGPAGTLSAHGGEPNKTLGSAIHRADELRAAAATGSLAKILSTIGLPPAPVVRSKNLHAALWRFASELRAANATVQSLVDPSDIALVRDLVHPDLSRRIPASARADLETMRAVASGIAAAIDDLVARGTRTSDRPKLHTRSSANCDVIDQPPLLCVSGDGDQTYSTNSYWGTIDLGGNDTYTNSTGVGACVGDVADAEADPCVGVTVDLAGDDEYSPGSLMHACEIAGFGPIKGVCAQGAGLLGIGMLVDADGNDRYEAVVKHKEEDCLGGQFTICGVLDAQGTTRFGVGVLADLAGNDSYTARAPLPAADAASDKSTTLAAQGVAAFGTALLWDDEGNDTYAVSGAATGFRNGGTIEGWSQYTAQAAAVAGEAVILDSAGQDSFSLTTKAGPGAGDRTSKSPYGEGAASGLSNISGGQGVGLPGFNIQSYGALITGDGPTTYTIDMSSRLRTQLQGQGSGQGGVLDDAGGDDRYLLFAHSAAEMHLSCVCNDATTLAIGSGAQVDGQGTSGGSLHDRGGNDDYQARALGDSRGTMTSDEDPTLTVKGGTATVSAQGVGQGSLVDDAGDDSYLARASTLATSEIIGEAGHAFASVADMLVNAQGIGGSLRDRAGSDSYVVEGRPQASATPYEPGNTIEGYYKVQGQGLRFALFYDLDGAGSLIDSDAGEPDHFAVESDALFEMCDGNGTYGQSPGWVSGQIKVLPTGEECSPIATGAAVTSGDTTRQQSNLEMTSVSPYGDELTQIDVELNDIGGAPLSDQRVRVSSEGLFGEPYYGVGPWRRWFYLGDSVEAITDLDGKATVFLPRTSAFCTAPSCEGLRWFATYFGNDTYAASFARGQ